MKKSNLIVWIIFIAVQVCLLMVFGINPWILVAFNLGNIIGQFIEHISN